MYFVKKSFRFGLLVSVLGVTACGYTNKSSYQEITFLTPDAKDAVCYVFVDKLKHKVYPPETLTLTNSSKDMLVECKAPGNREVSITVPAKFYTKALWGGPAGVAWDYASRSSHSYPSVVAIDFSQEELKPNSPPSHNNDDIMQPEDHDLEEFRPSTPRMNSDKHDTQMPILRRGEEYPADVAEEPNHSELPSDEIIAVEGVEDAEPVVDEKVDLQSVIESLPQAEADAAPSDNSSHDVAEEVLDAAPDDSDVVIESVSEPSVGADAVSEPIQIYPGQ